MHESSTQPNTFRQQKDFQERMDRRLAAQRQRRPGQLVGHHHNK